MIESLIAARIDRGPPFAVISRDTVISGVSMSRGDLHPDGDRLIATQNVGADDVLAPERFLVVVNWFEELRQRMGNN